MKIQYDPLLTETVVLQEINRQQEAGDRALFCEYHVAADPLYHRRPEARNAAFQGLHEQFFNTLGFPELLRTELHEFPSIESRASEVVVALAAGSHEEGADLSLEEANGNGQPAKRVGIRLMADRFLDLPTLRRYLRHELLHIADLLDPSFGYEGEVRLAIASPAEENIIRNRYRLLWCLSIDARLESAGGEPLADRDSHRRDFDAQYRKFSPAVREAIFERLWRSEPLSHSLLLQMVTGSEALLRLAGDTGPTGSKTPRHVPLPGSPCPLCRFPSYHFVEDHTVLDNTLVTEIQKDFSSFTMDDNLCERCLEVYTLRAGRW